MFKIFGTVLYSPDTVGNQKLGGGALVIGTNKKLDGSERPTV